MGLIDDRLAKEKAELPPRVVPVRRYMDAARVRQKMPLGTPSFYIDYFLAVAREMESQGIQHFNPERDMKKGGGILSEQELDRMDDFAERHAPALEFVAWVKSQRGL